MSTSAIRHRLVAILAADAAGYARLMAADERATIASLDGARAVFRRQIESNQGRVIDMAGDSVLAIFESTAGAVAAALGIQQELDVVSTSVPVERQMRFRIGIHLGDIVEKADGTVYGDGVNVAARLQGLAEAGGVTVSDAVRGAVKGKIGVEFEDKGEQAVKNIAEPIRTFQMKLAETKGTTRKPGGDDFDLSLSDKPSIAVLPFTNISGDPEQTYFADGMTEDIITLLASVSELLVVARNSTFAYKGRSPDVREVAKELGVRYVLEGSVRKSGSRIRITAQFIDARSGNHIWAERYDRDIEDIFAVQDEVAQGIVGALQSQLLMAEARLGRRKRPEVLDAWSNVVQAKVKLYGYRRNDIDEAEPFARHAIRIDPSYGEAHAVLGHILSWRSYNAWTDDWYGVAKESAACCERALVLAPNDSAILADVGSAYSWLGRFRKALPILELAVTLNPNSALTCARYGETLAVCGDPEGGMRFIRHAIRLSPKDPLGYMLQQSLAQGEYFSGRYEAALEAANRALQGNAGLTLAPMFRVAACVKLGRRDEARELLLKRFEQGGASWAVDNIFRPRTEGTLWGEYTSAIREVMDREPRR